MFPLSWQEVAGHHSVAEENKQLSHRLIYGMYPDVISQPGHEKEVLRNLTDRFLYKDLLSYHDVRKPEVMDKIIQALSLQIGSKVSYNEIAEFVNSDPATVSRYIDLLEQSMLVFRIPSLGRILKNEIKKSRKIYFYDNGIRNAILANYQTPEIRQDIGALWENFLVAERLKFVRYNSIHADRYFWRTKQQQEIDYIEELDGKLSAFDFQWKPTKKIKPSLTFTKAYPDNVYKVITPDNYPSFIST
jgi:predicted AAA+ superfamily ATPase